MGRYTAVTMRLAGAAADADGSGRQVLPGVTNYLIGNDPRAWRKGVRSYGEVQYRAVYPGIDVVYYGNQRQLEFDFIVAPGANARAIALAFDGTTGLRIDRDGNLLVGTAAGTLVQHAPVIYQEKSGRRNSVRGGYVLRRDGSVGFDVRSYDPNLPLVIDPVLTYSTYLGGSREERVAGVGFDAQGNMYVAGETGAMDFPLSSPANWHGLENWDTFVVKLNPAGISSCMRPTSAAATTRPRKAWPSMERETRMWRGRPFRTIFRRSTPSSPRGVGSATASWPRWTPMAASCISTYLGGNDEDGASGIAVDALGRAYVTGATISSDFPTLNALQPSLGGHPAFRTTDGGHTWAGIGTGLRATWVRAFAIDPANTQIVYAGTYSDGVFKSTDGGSTWTRDQRRPCAVSLKRDGGRLDGSCIRRQRRGPLPKPR